MYIYVYIYIYEYRVNPPLHRLLPSKIRVPPLLRVRVWSFTVRYLSEFRRRVSSF